MLHGHERLTVFWRISIVHQYHIGFVGLGCHSFCLNKMNIAIELHIVVTWFLFGTNIKAISCLHHIYLKRAIVSLVHVLAVCQGQSERQHQRCFLCLAVGSSYLARIASVVCSINAYLIRGIERLFVCKNDVSCGLIGSTFLCISKVVGSMSGVLGQEYQCVLSQCILQCGPRAAVRRVSALHLAPHVYIKQLVHCGGYVASASCNSCFQLLFHRFNRAIS